MIKKEITYGEEPYIAYDNIIGGRQVFIIYMGMHPCAYVECDTNYYGNEFGDEPVHWGFTYYNTLLHWKIRLSGYDEEKMKKYYIGWDYGHFGDYMEHRGKIVNEGKKWTTDEIIEEIKRAVEWLNEKENKQND